MKKIILSFLTLPVLALSAGQAFSADLMVAQTMQRCTTNEECTLVTNSCADNCAYVPINKSNMTALGTLYQTRCGKAMDANPQCTMNPPIAAACVNSRCTIDYAYANNAGAKDYKSGAYAAPEAAVPSKVPAGAYAGVNDRNGNFTAYNLPQGEVKQNTVGQIVTKVYVPPSAPVSGGNYVTIGQQPAAPAPAVAPTPAPAPAPKAAAPSPVYPAAAPATPVVPPVAVPTNKTYATPPAAVPAPAPAAPAQAPAAMPKPAPVANTGAPIEYVAPQTVLVAPPSAAAAAQKPVPSFAGTPRAPVIEGPNGIPAVGAPGVPLAPPGSVPIPPSDLKPAPTFVPPAGTASTVSPEDPGAPPPPGTTLIAPTAKDGDVTLGTKSFGGIPAKKSTSSDLN